MKKKTTTVKREQLLKLFSENLLVDEKKIKSAFRLRNRTYNENSVAHSDVDEYLSKNWEVHRTLKTRTNLRKQKQVGSQLEDDFWVFLQRMGYQIINSDHFKLPYKRADGTLDKKQIDVFVADEETALVVECKACKTRSKRSLSKDLAETISFKGAMARTINNYFAPSKLKTIWIYVTRNVIWSQPDADRAKAAGIKIITDNELEYYSAFIKHVGKAGRFQILGELIGSQAVAGLSGHKVLAAKGRIGGYPYYSFVASAKDILKLSFVNHYALNLPEGQPAYQRMVSNTRLKKIGKFIDEDGYFPTNIILNFSEEQNFEQVEKRGTGSGKTEYGWLHLPNKYKSAWVIDGQHRLYGYSFAEPDSLDDDVLILAFEGMDKKSEAELFITINQEQKSVPRSIIVALQADLKWGSKDLKDRMAAITSRVVLRLSNDKTSPLFQRVVVEGLGSNAEKSLTIPELSKGINRVKLVGEIKNDLLIPGPGSDSTDLKSVERATNLLIAWFNEVSSLAPDRWDSGKEGFFCTNPGIRAYISLLSEIIEYTSSKSKYDPLTSPIDYLIEKATPLLTPLCSYYKNAPKEEIDSTFSRKFGEGGVREYFYLLCEIVWSENKDFGSDEFREYVRLKHDERLNQAHLDVISLNEKMMDIVHSSLRDKYGTSRHPRTGEELWWEQGISSQKAKRKAFDRQLADDLENKKEKFAYLDVLDIRDIIKESDNWALFESRFNKRMPDERKGKKYYLDWMETFNELRKIPAHSSKLRVYSDTDYNFIEWLKEEFTIKS